ncbi:alpha/beta hydrolase [Schlesneria paludicola]|uniref:alpha/beta hydrolase n=1 Tax=Schlesneria paludicola TaxID=360056 RepID=UPI00029A6B4E|nr:alpha/beta hydrolase [Schlesneria paludicola]
MICQRREVLIGLVFLTGLIQSPSFCSAQQADLRRIPLWNGQAPTGEGQFETADTFISVHLAPEPNGTAIVIFPGGGYGGLAKVPEGDGIAAWLNRHGITGVVVEYRLPAQRTFVPLLDAQRAIRYTRLNAADWKINPAKIGVIGFSAGGHLASTTATHFDLGNAQSANPIDRISCRPDFAILIYPVITMGEKTHQGSRKNLLGGEPSAKMVELFSNERQVSDKTPPTFLAHALDDSAVVIDNSRLFYEALKAHDVPGRLLELPSGGHGLNGYKGPMWDAWQNQSLAWLAEMKLTP